MKMSGFAGAVLRIDLTRKSVEKEPLDMDLARKFIGPEGVSFRWFYDLTSPGMDPFAENSPIIIGAGPIVGALFLRVAGYLRPSNTPVTGD